MSTERHEALKLAENIDKFSGYCTSRAAETIRTQHALIVQLFDALAVCEPSAGIPAEPRKQAIAAATQYLKGPKT